MFNNPWRHHPAVPLTSPMAASSIKLDMISLRGRAPDFFEKNNKKMAANFICEIARPAFDCWRRSAGESHEKLLAIISARFEQYGESRDLIDDAEYQAEYGIYKNLDQKRKRLGEQIVSFDPRHFGKDPYRIYRFYPDEKKDFYNHLTAQSVLADCDDFEVRWEAFITQSE